MSSKNLLIFSIIGIILLIAIFLGIIHRSPIRSKESVPEITAASIPYLGPVQVLNGCSIAGAGDRMADFLRARKFDVKNIGNAPERNYSYTLIISRSKNMTIAHQLGSVLHTDHCVLMRNGEETYAATVIIGPDYEERIR
jgi:hypothetical protein